MKVTPPEGLSDVEFVDWLDTINTDDELSRKDRARAYALAERYYNLDQGWRELNDNPKNIVAIARSLMVKAVVEKLS